METRLCTTCGELVPQGSCTCGDKQELVKLGYPIEQAKADFLAYKADGGDMDGLEWCYFNAPALFAKWQDKGQVDGDWIYYPAPGQEATR